MPEFVTNRKQAHVTLLKQMRTKNYWSMSEAEKNLWKNEASKGAYNYTDLNRVESAVAEIAGLMGLTLEIKTDWSRSDVPMPYDLARYLNNIKTLRDNCPIQLDFPELPDSMQYLTYQYANNIEMVLYLVYRALGGIVETDNVLGTGKLGQMKLGTS